MPYKSAAKRAEATLRWKKSDRGVARHQLLKAERQRRLSFDKSIKHGILKTYNEYGCRCGSCRGAYSIWYSLYSVSNKKPALYKKLSPARQSAVSGASDELKKLIQEQQNDDATTTAQYGTSLGGIFEEYTTDDYSTFQEDFSPELIEQISEAEGDLDIPISMWKNVDLVAPDGEERPSRPKRQQLKINRLKRLRRERPHWKTMRGQWA